MSDINLIANASVGDVEIQVSVNEPTAELNVVIEASEPKVEVALEGYGGGGVDFTTDETLVLEGGVLRVNATDAAIGNDPRPITAQGVYNEFSVINALLKTI